jgi:transcription antitermination factor NusG
LAAKWIAISSKPHKEEALYRKLQADGYEIFFPRYPQDIGGTHVIKPYFPGYLFVKVDLDLVGISTFQWMPFAIGPVDYCGKPAYIPDRLIIAIQKKVNRLSQAANSSTGGLNLDKADDIQEYKAILDVRLSTEERIGALLQVIQQETVPN